ncbi:serine hydrolase domain-containing protein [Alteromonas sp. ASW11-130]|uniref:serine hydrolase domain-containing protein n=1 Tax=Alteromonas sp. ASW11-130 TaxID=3015775 RepID=UPI002242867D|nr:serine hydrolase domain-containing protein [Alteromonas sp. ASW11-130]MCW8092951.1 serine hydrolase [Alteromonas sp. ASW11-130]
MRLLFFIIIIILIGCTRSIAPSAEDYSLPEEQIRAIMAAYHVPGVAIGVIRNNEILALQGFGVADIQTQQPVTPDTIFKIGSNTKAMTTALLAMLVDEGKLRWSDKVKEHIPNFELYNEYVTNEFTIIDLLTHRSGLGLGAGDLMLWPEPSGFSRGEIIHNLRYLRQDGEFRADYAYDNLLYIVAGELVPAITQTSWDSFIHTRIFERLSMKNCFVGQAGKKQLSLVSKPYTIVNGELVHSVRQINQGKPHVSAAAGGVNCSARDMLKWLALMLNKGKFNQSESLFSKTQYMALTRPHTIMPVTNYDKTYNRTHFSAYGLGWRLNDVDGYLRVHHSGSLAGMYSATTLFPELNLGIIVLTNQQSSAARRTLMYTIMKPFLGDTTTDWLTVLQPTSEKNARELSVPASDIWLDADSDIAKSLLGEYRDPWFGEIHFEQEEKRIKVSSVKMKRLVGYVSHPPRVENISENLIVRWNDRSMDADVAISISSTNIGRPVMRLTPVSEFIDFSYNFDDLRLIKTK